MAIITLTFDLDALDVIESNCIDCDIQLTNDGDVMVFKRFDYEPDSWEHAADMFNLTEVLDHIIYCEVE